MAEKQKPNYSDFEKYQFGYLAGILGSSEESARYAPSALEVLANEGLKLNGDAKKHHASFGEQSEEQIKRSIGIYSGEFLEARGKFSPADLAGWYSDVLSGLNGDETARIVGCLRNYDEPYGAITKKVMKANHIVKGEGIGANTPEETADAKKTLEKYSVLMQVMNTLDNYKFEGLKPKVINMKRVEDLKGIASNLPEIKSQKKAA